MLRCETPWPPGRRALHRIYGKFGAKLSMHHDPREMPYQPQWIYGCDAADGTDRLNIAKDYQGEAARLRTLMRREPHAGAKPDLQGAFRHELLPIANHPTCV